MSIKITIKALIICVASPLILGACSKEQDIKNQYINMTCDEAYMLASRLIEQASNNANHTVYDVTSNKLYAILNDCSGHAGILKLYALTMMALGNNTEAYKYAEKSILLDGSDWEANYILGQVLTLNGNYEDGLKYIERSISMTPIEYRINTLLGYCSALGEYGEYNKTISACTEVINASEKVEDIGPAYFIRARAYEKNGDHDDAAEDYSKAKSLGFDGRQYYSEPHFSEKKQ